MCPLKYLEMQPSGKWRICFSLSDLVMSWDGLGSLNVCYYRIIFQNSTLHQLICLFSNEFETIFTELFYWCNYSLIQILAFVFTWCSSFCTCSTLLYTLCKINGIMLKHPNLSPSNKTIRLYNTIFDDECRTNLWNIVNKFWVEPAYHNTRLYFCMFGKRWQWCDKTNSYWGLFTGWY